MPSVSPLGERPRAGGPARPVSHFWSWQGWTALSAVGQLLAAGLALVAILVTLRRSRMSVAPHWVPEVDSDAWAMLQAHPVYGDAWWCRLRLVNDGARASGVWTDCVVLHGPPPLNSTSYEPKMERMDPVAQLVQLNVICGDPHHLRALVFLRSRGRVSNAQVFRLRSNRVPVSNSAEALPLPTEFVYMWEITPSSRGQFLLLWGDLACRRLRWTIGAIWTHAGWPPWSRSSPP